MNPGEYRKEFLSVLKENQSTRKQNYLGTSNGILKEYYWDLMRRTDSVENIELVEKYLRQKNVEVLSTAKQGRLNRDFLESGRTFFKDQQKKEYRSGLNDLQSEAIVDGLVVKEKRKMRDHQKSSRNFRFLTQPKNYLKKEKENVKEVNLLLKRKKRSVPVSNYNRKKRKPLDSKVQSRVRIFRRIESEPRINFKKQQPIKIKYFKNFVKSNFIIEQKTNK